MKKGPLSKEDKVFIDNNSDMSTVDLSKKLKRSEGSIEKYVATLDKKTTTTKKTDENSDIDLFARKEDRGVVVMTEAASMSADSSKADTSSLKANKYRDVIHKIREE